MMVGPQEREGSEEALQVGEEIDRVRGFLRTCNLRRNGKFLGDVRMGKHDF